VATAGELDDPVRRGCLAVTQALAAGYAAEPGDDDWVARARDEFSRAGHEIGLGYVAYAEGARNLVAGDLTSAAQSLETAVDAFRDHGDHLGLILAVSRLGELAWRTGDIDLFIEMHADLLELGRAGRAQGVVAGATARLAVGRLAQGALADAQDLARAALASSGGSFMPVVNGFAFHAAALVDLASGHVREARHGLDAAIEAFARGAGQVGAGYAAMCFVDLSRSYAATGDVDEARRAADDAVALARATGDPWVLDRAAAQRESVGDRA